MKTTSRSLARDCCPAPKAAFYNVRLSHRQIHLMQWLCDFYARTGENARAIDDAKRLKYCLERWPKPETEQPAEAGAERRPAQDNGAANYHPLKSEP